MTQGGPGIEEDPEGSAFLARRMVATFGDACVVYVLSEDEYTLSPAAFAARDRDADAWRKCVAEGPVDVSAGVAGACFESVGPVSFVVDADAPGLFAGTPEAGVRGGSVVAVPLRARGQTVGVLEILRDAGRPAFDPDEVEQLRQIAARFAATLLDSRLLVKAESRLQRLTALRQIDLAMTASTDLRLTLQVILDRVTAQLGADAADILLLNPRTQILELACDRGFRSLLPRVHLRLGEGYAGRAALERQPVSIPDFSVVRDFRRTWLLAEEGFVAYQCSPLLARGRVCGVLELFHRMPLRVDAEWSDFFHMVATQAAIAVDNAEMVDELRRANSDLMLAYDQTLEGWMRVLDMRDQETEGHSSRVASLAVGLAGMMGVDRDQLLHIRRGAILHDIGKMAVPDAILRKPGPLTPEERNVMQRHPVHARELLSDIPYLRPALSIPYGHHERWDGSGYPQGLEGEAIPLPARVFAVVDVWDALVQHRPYRRAWPPERVLDHLSEEAGRLFDPLVVDAFVRSDLHVGYPIMHLAGDGSE